MNGEALNETGETWADDPRNQWHGRKFCPHPDQPCIDGCAYCGRTLRINDHNHIFLSKKDKAENRYACTCFYC